ncbi:FAD-binding protein [Alkalibacillus silvisoli]|uniref:L-aspartate oxidase n=1 Tax=Alkalibacillus silvisoli TaxID=392823 RepID=A0ABP3JMA7_9BACI
MLKTDILIIGSGIAALQLATKLNQHYDVTIVTKGKITNSNSYLAQGGIAAAISESDHVYDHAYDTLKAGEYFNLPFIVNYVTKKAPNIIKQLINDGVIFDHINQQLILGKEGAHQQRRIVHAGGDATGKHLINSLINQLDDSITLT